MPKVLHRAPRWLDHGTPAYDFFQDDKSKTQAQTSGPSKKIAHRETEVFFAVGNELRWSDLAYLKEAGEGDARQGRQPNTSSTYKVLKTPAWGTIQQITVSPSGDFIVVLTTHTCHACILPPREHLNFHDPTPLKLRSFQVGPAAHVVEQSPLVSAIWHPLTPSGNGLVTVTKDACVRLWELDQQNRSSFGEPSLAIDLKKLANATTRTEDLGISSYGTKHYSPDDAEMEVAASCFGGKGRQDEDGWSSMTLWVAMSEGDVYALCPFLPSQFWIPQTTLPSLSTSVVSKLRILDYDRQATELDKTIANQQSNWLTDLDQQDEVTNHGENAMDCYFRPEKPGAIPRLQGPFQLSPEPDFGEITDIHVVAPKINQEDLFDDEEDLDDLGVSEGLSIGIVCLATSTNQVHICLNVEGVEAEWLPAKRRGRHYMDDTDAVRHLLLFETVDLARGSQGVESWPTFTDSPVDEHRYELFTTQPTGIYSLSFKPWIGSLEDELSSPAADTEGVGFRLNVILESAGTTVQQLTADVSRPLQQVNASVAIWDDQSDFDYVVLTSAQNQPLAAILDPPYAAANPFEPDAYPTGSSFAVPETRAPYQPSDVFFRDSRLPAQIDAWRKESANGAAGNIKGGINFSPYTLQKITEAHRTLSSETHTLGLAAADLFRHCERMMNELRSQIEKVRELSNRVNSVTGEDEFPEQKPGEPELVRGGKLKIQSRIQDREAKTQEIQDRVERLRKKMRGLGGKEMSARERAFAEEVARIEKLVLPAGEEVKPTEPANIVRMDNSTITTSTDDSFDDGDQDSLPGRFKAVQEVYAQLRAQAETLQKELDAKKEEGSRPGTAASGSVYGGDAYKQRKMDEVWRLLERETALVEGVTERLQKLEMASR